MLLKLLRHALVRAGDYLRAVAAQAKYYFTDRREYREEQKKPRCPNCNCVVRSGYLCPLCSKELGVSSGNRRITPELEQLFVALGEAGDELRAGAIWAGYRRPELTARDKAEIDAAIKGLEKYEDFVDR